MTIVLELNIQMNHTPNMHVRLCFPPSVSASAVAALVVGVIAATVLFGYGIFRAAR